ncbi:MAG: hypothetical protein IPK28_05640 [Devosia sp.]|nr:hypothetical protein [Devosia sp.]
MRTGYRWLGRYRTGDRQLADRSSAPRRCPHRLAAAQIERIAQLRRQRLTGPAIAGSWPGPFNGGIAAAAWPQPPGLARAEAAGDPL